ncbi:MAG: alpha/beta fold hydrolase [Chloroflexi bacterium]|nr:alpha/beta fold hydrolase [Chloroflexota bacterium]
MAKPIPAPPMMLVWGAQDRIIPVSHAYRAQQVAPQARLHVFDQCGHWPHMEKASAFNSAVLEFLSGR